MKNKISKTIFFLSIVSMIFIGGNVFAITCGEDFIDSRDAQTYSTVQIGSQCWMKENLNYTTPNSWCYDNNSINCDSDGRLYNANDALTACPSGWHLPTISEWQNLYTFTDSWSNQGKLRATSPIWDGGDVYGLGVVPSGILMDGFKFIDSGTYVYGRADGSWPSDYYYAVIFGTGMSSIVQRYEPISNALNYGFSVRCLEGDPVINGACGTAHTHGYSSTSEIDTATERCAAGTFSGSFIDNTSYWQWSCNGLGGGTNATCSANKAVCSSYDTQILANQPSVLCQYGDNVGIVFSENTWVWICSNNPGQDDPCYTRKTTCGTSNGGTFPSAPTENLCLYGNASGVTTNPTTYTWTCTGNDTIPVSCSANKTEVSYDATCGTSNGGIFSTTPTTNLCSSGTASSVSINPTTYTWTCDDWTVRYGFDGWTWRSIAMSSDGKYQTAVVENEKIYVSSNYGVTWTAKNSNRYWVSVAMSSTGQYQTAVVENGRIYVSSDYGVNWIEKGPTSNLYWKEVAISSSGQDQVAVNDAALGGSIYVSNNYGETWVSHVVGAYSKPRAVAISSDGTHMTAVGYGGGMTYEPIYVSIDSGATWTSKQTDQLWYDVAMSSDGVHQTALGYSNGYISQDSGSSWTLMNHTAKKIAISSNGVYQTTSSGYISSNYGATWTQKTATSGTYPDVAMSSDGKYQTLVSGTGLKVSEDFGNTWSLVSSASAWRDIAVSSTGQHQTAVNGLLYSLKGRIYATNNYNGLPASCSATRITNGICGTANNHGYSATSYIDTSAERCLAGTFSGSFVDRTSYWEWSCNGINGGTSAVCRSNKVVGGNANGQTLTTEPTYENLCTYGTPTTVSLVDNVWQWSCTDNPGQNASCSTYKTTCGSSNGGTFENQPENNLCLYGNASSVTTNPTTYTWTCTGNDTAPVSCSATRTTTVTYLDPTDINSDESCWYCEHYYDAYGYLQNGKVVDGNAVLDLGFSITTPGYTSYKIGIGTNSSTPSMETTDWLSFSGTSATFSGTMVTKSGTDQKNGNNGFYITYGNGTSEKTYYWFLKLTGEETWRLAGSFNTPKKPFPLVRIAADKQVVTINTNIQYCTTLPSLDATTDLCYPVCWKGTGSPSLTSDDWKCSVCYNSSGSPALCTTENDQNAFFWTLPMDKGVYVNSTYSTPNPVFKYTTSIGDAKPGLAIQGSECAAEGETGTRAALPIWRETN